MSWFKEEERRFNELTKNTIKCKCGCSTVMSYKTDRCVCRWCGKYLYRTPAIEFRYKMNDELRKIK